MPGRCDGSRARTAGQSSLDGVEDLGGGVHLWAGRRAKKLGVGSTTRVCVKQGRKNKLASNPDIRGHSGGAEDFRDNGMNTCRHLKQKSEGKLKTTRAYYQWV